MGGWKEDSAGGSGKVKIFLVATNSELKKVWRSSLTQLGAENWAQSKAAAGPQERQLQALLDDFKK